jgi:hypothetical protein
MTQPNQPIKKHLDSKQFRDDRLWELRNGQWFTWVDGYQFTEAEFNECWPLFNPITFVHTKENIDPRTNFLRN